MDGQSSRMGSADQDFFCRGNPRKLPIFRNEVLQISHATAFGDPPDSYDSSRLQLYRFPLPKSVGFTVCHVGAHRQ